MDPLWMLSFFWLIGEVIIVLLLCLPMHHSIRGLVLKSFDAFEASANAQTVAKAIFALLSLQFTYAIWSLNHLDDHKHAHDSQIGILMNRVALFRNQRNAYLTGFALFLMLVIWKFEKLHRKAHINRTEKNVAAAEKKAAADDYKKNVASTKDE